jgi:iron(III) transport system substrate-binding protein
VGLALVMVTALFPGCGRTTPPPRVVLYCGQDLEFAEGLLKQFTETTGVQVEIRGDTEANKTVTLAEAIIREAPNPRCDVFWSNEPLNVLRLRRKGLLAAYASPAAPPPPAWLRANQDGQWHAFAARARILVVRKDVPEPPRGLADLTGEKWRGQVCLAKPLFGTSATHAACLFQALGPEAAKQLYQGLKANGVAVLPGNKDVAVAVGEGKYAVGLTDTDDAVEEMNKGRPVRIVYPDQEGVGTLFLPNALALIAGGPNPAQARQLADFLLGPKAEEQLAQGPSAQIPLHPGVAGPATVRTPAQVKPLAVDLDQAAERWEEAQAFLRNEFLR